MKKSHFILFLLILLPLLIPAQVPQWRSADSFGSAGQEETWSVAVDTLGNRYVTGFYNGTFSLGTHVLPASSGNDIFAAKQAPDGTWLWALSGNGPGDDRGLDIAVDDMGFVYVCGFFEQTAAIFGFPMSSYGGRDGFVAILSPEGYFYNFMEVNGQYRDECISVTCTGSGTAYVTGYFEGVSYFNNWYSSSSLTSAGERDVFVASMEASGLIWWSRRAGGPNDDLGMSVACDTAGDIYVTGTFWGNPSFGTTTLYNSGYWDNFVAKIDYSGNWLWAKQGVSAGSEWAWGIAVDASANVFITGNYDQDITLGATTLIRTGTGGQDFYTAKLDTNGNWLWATGAGGAGSDWAYSLALDTAGDVYLAGNFDSPSAYFGTFELSAVNWADVFVAKLSSSGVWQWAKWAGGVGSEWCHGIAVDISGRIYITGNFDYQISCGVFDLNSAGGYDIFLATLDIYDPDEDWLWATRAGGGNEDVCLDTATDSQGNQYVTGYFTSEAAFGTTTLTGSGGADVFVAKLDPNGNWLWAVKAGGPGTDAANALVLDASGNVYITGYFDSVPAYFGTTVLASMGGNDLFAAKLNTDGAWQWAVQSSGAGNEYGTDLTVDAYNFVFLTGYFDNSFWLGNFHYIVHGGSDALLAALDSSGQWQGSSQSSGTGNEIATGITMTAANHICLTGQYIGDLAFGTHTFSNPEPWSDIFVAFMNRDAGWIWVAGSAGVGSAWSEGIACDNSGNLYITGYYDTDIALGSVYLPNSGPGAQDVFIAKLDGGGNWLWGRHSLGGSSEQAFDLALDAQANVYVTGTFQWDVTFGTFTLVNPEGWADIFLVKLGTDGNWLWARSPVSPGSNESRAVVIDNSNDVRLAGCFDAYTWFGEHQVYTAGFKDVFAARLDQDYIPGIPLSPQNLSIALSAPGEVTLAWDPVTHDTGGNPVSPVYKIYMAQNPGGPFLLFATTALTHYTFVPTPALQYRFFYVTAEN